MGPADISCSTRRYLILQHAKGKSAQFTVILLSKTKGFGTEVKDISGFTLHKEIRSQRDSGNEIREGKTAERKGSSWKGGK